MRPEGKIVESRGCKLHYGYSAKSDSETAHRLKGRFSNWLLVVPADRSKLAADYYFVIAPLKQPRNLWGREIRRRSEPIALTIYRDNFASENDARLAGEKALDELLDRLAAKTNR
jgi:hypothetical protein